MRRFCLILAAGFAMVAFIGLAQQSSTAGPEQNLATMPRAKTLTLDSKTNNILPIAAQYGPPPAPPAPSADAPKDVPKKGGGRPPMLPDSFSILVVGK